MYFFMIKWVVFYFVDILFSKIVYLLKHILVFELRNKPFFLLYRCEIMITIRSIDIILQQHHIIARVYVLFSV